MQARLAMVFPTEDTALLADADAYAAELQRELSGENAFNLGTHNQLVEFIVEDPELSTAVKRWAASRNILEATTAPPERLPRDELYERTSRLCREIGEPPALPPLRPVEPWP